MRRMTSGTILVMILLLLSITADAWAGAAQTTPLPEEQNVIVYMQDMRAPCELNKATGTASGYWSNYQSNYGSVTYFDPAVDCGGPAYPYEMSVFHTTFYDPGGYTWPVVAAIVVYDMAVPGLPCAGPGDILDIGGITFDSSTFAYPNTGSVAFQPHLCIDGPVFVGLSYVSGNAGSTPSIVFDDNTMVDTCDNWVQTPIDVWNEWYDFWTPPRPGYPIFWVSGESQSAFCGYEPCDWIPGNPYKMHYPQLPDTMGWDIEAGDILALADDWRCTESGFVKDIHFWGSYMSGNEIPIIAFDIYVFSDVPASQSPSGYSMPGELLWQQRVFDNEFMATPLVSESSEGWFDPLGPILPEDHNQYYRYDICLDTNWFYQEAGTVYWLGISALGTGPTWGWKSSQSHWNDNAVYFFYPPGDFVPWEELYDPLTEQPLDLSFVITNGTTGDCYVNVGEADASGEIDIDDVVFLISYIFSGGPAPLPYSTVSGDADCSCTVDIDDVVYLIAYIFSGGNPPCTCADWMATCGSIK